MSGDFSQLPPEVLNKITSYLPAADLARLQNASKTLHEQLRDTKKANQELLWLKPKLEQALEVYGTQIREGQETAEKTKGQEGLGVVKGLTEVLETYHLPRFTPVFQEASKVAGIDETVLAQCQTLVQELDALLSSANEVIAKYK